MNRITVRGGVFILALFMLTASAVVYAASKEDAKAMVKKVEAFYKKNGKAKMIEEVQKDKGQFEKGEIYVYIFTPEGTVLAHPKLKSWVGKSFHNLKDPDGKFFIKDVLEILKTQQDCWMEYKWNNPETKKIGQKIGYFLKVDDFVLASGVNK